MNYHINKEVYDIIKSGRKTVEYRLLNNKSKSIKSGDKITFIYIDDESKTIDAEVIGTTVYNSYSELWADATYNNILCDTIFEFKNKLYDIYGKEKVDSSKIIGIEFKKCMKK